MKVTIDSSRILLVSGVALALVGGGACRYESAMPPQAEGPPTRTKGAVVTSDKGPTTAELIDRLTDEGKEGVGTHSTAWAVGFMPVDTTPRFAGGILGSAPPEKSAVMTELVHRGVDALPLLLEHLSDPRPTKLKVGKDFTGKWFGDEYDPRFADPNRQPKEVNEVEFGLEQGFDEYVLKVGDLCYVAVGQIVNRGLNAVRYQPSMCLVVNSPIEKPALAAAVRQDWNGLTAEAHEQSLVDATSSDEPYAAPGALVRLLHYYPKAGGRIALKLLHGPIAGESSLQGQEDLVRELAAFGGPDLDAAILDLFRQLKAYEPSELGERLYRGDCALACADRLIGKGHDGEFRRFFSEQLSDVRKGLALIKKGEGPFYSKYAPYDAALMQRVEFYETFLTRLNASKPKRSK